MEEIFDDLICLDEEGESVEADVSENLLEIKQRTRCPRMPELCVNRHRKHDNIARRRFPNGKQISSRYYCCEKTSDLTRGDFHGGARCSRVERIENMDELTVDTNLLEVDSCEGDDNDCSESKKSSTVHQLPGKGENRVSVNHASLTSSVGLQIYGDDEDWPYLSGDVDEEAVRLAASLDPSATEEAKDGSQQDPRDASEKMTDKWNSQQYCNSNESSCHSKAPDKLDGIWSLHLWKSMYSTSIRQLCCFRHHIGKILRDYMCSLDYFSDTTLLTFSSVILKVRKMLL